MNDPRPPLSDDELSAHLDGEGAPDLADRIAAEPRAAARLEELRAAATAVSGARVDDLAPSVVDDLVRRALDAGPDVDGGASAAGTDADAVVTPLARPARSAPSLLVAAVVLVLVAAGLGLVYSGTRGGDATDTAASGGSATAERQADEAAPEVAEDADTSGAGSDGAAGGASPTTTTSTGAAAYAGIELPDLGTFDTPEALRSSLGPGFPASVPTARASTDAGPIEQIAVDRCAGLLREVLPVTADDPTHVGVARVAGETVLVYELVSEPDRTASTTTEAGAPATTLTTAVRPQACDPLFVFQR